MMVRWVPAERCDACGRVLEPVAASSRMTFLGGDADSLARRQALGSVRPARPRAEYGSDPANAKPGRGKGAGRKQFSRRHEGEAGEAHC